MPEKEIPTEDCEKETKEIEEDGTLEVISCEPIDDKPGWSRIVWKYK